MQRFRVWWNSFKTVAILFSFILNLVLMIVLLLVVMQLFQIKNGILEPLIDGLHRNFVGLDEATIIRTIEVEDTIPVTFTLPLDKDVSVVLTEDVAIAANATFTLPGNGGMINGRVDIVLPQNLVLPIHLAMEVPVDTTIPINLPVDVQIPLNETQLHRPFYNLRALLEPYVRALDHLPDNWGDVPGFTIDAIQGDGINLVSPSDESRDPWPGFDVDSSTFDLNTGVEAEESADEPENRTAFPEPSAPGVEGPGPTMTFTPFPTLTPTPE